MNLTNLIPNSNHGGQSYGKHYSKQRKIVRKIERRNFVLNKTHCLNEILSAARTRTVSFVLICHTGVTLRWDHFKVSKEKRNDNR